MRRLRFLPIGLVVLLSCSREEPVDTSGLEKGNVVISLSMDATGTDAGPASKSVDENAPESADDFEIEIYNSNGTRLYRDTYANSAGKEIPLNSGDYRLLAQYGDSAAVSFDASAAWYAADLQFTVRPQTSESVNATAKMSKVKVAVNHGPNITDEYADLYSTVKQEGASSELKFVKGETRSGYIPAGSLVYALYVQDKETSEWVYYHTDPVEYAANSFVTFNVDINRGVGSLGGVTVNVDYEVDGITKEYQIPATAGPKDAPAIVLKGFTDNAFSFVEAVGYEGVQVDLQAMGGIKGCTLNILESQYLADKGVTGSIDLLSSGSPANETLETLGFRWVRDMSEKRLGSIDFTHLSEKMVYDASSAFSGRFSVTLTDMLDRTVTSQEFTITQKPASLSFSPADFNAFAKRIKGLEASTSDGNPESITVQYSQDGASWTTVGASSVSGQTASFPDITGLSSQTQYMVRAIYNGNESNATVPVTLTTEAEAQVGNAGFEEWSDQDVKVFTNGSKTQKTYFPYAADTEKWWDSNNTATAKGTGTLDPDPLDWVGSSFPTFKCFPMVTYTDGRNGGRAAQIMAIAINNANTSGTSLSDATPGELFIGTYGGERQHGFSSRPSKLCFYYKYTPRFDNSHDTDTFRAYITIMNGSDIIGEGSFEYTAAAEVSDWTKVETDIAYSDYTAKATAIYIQFRQSTADKPVYNMNVQITYPAGTAGVHGGSILTVDDVELIYE